MGLNMTFGVFNVGESPAPERLGDECSLPLLASWLPADAKLACACERTSIEAKEDADELDVLPAYLAKST